MNNKSRSILRVIAVLLVLLAVLMELEIIIIPALAGMKFWMMVIAFGVMLISNR
ncbi:MAG: hypothetical protein HRU69_08820 [Flammeovirgaceae bacterium]|nr:MAG: hypothetical protein HRU69_08820 [Flammeovirgaceae bacterium]